MAEPRLLVWDNPDKPDRGPPGAEDAFAPAPPYGFRWGVFGPPNCGKRALILSVVWQCMRKAPKRVIVIHADPDTTEWDVLSELGASVEVYSPASEDLPTFADVTRADRCLLIIDEVSLKDLPKGPRETLSRLFSYGSSHKGIGVVLSFQDPNRTTPEVRRALNIYTLFRLTDLEMLRSLALRLGVLPEELMELRELLKSPHDSITIRADEASDSPMRYCLNWFSPVFRKPGAKE